MRNKLTPAENLVWLFLKANFSQHLFYRQKPLENFIADFYCSKLKLIIEVDGEIHLQQKEKDLERDDYFLQQYGIRTLRIINEDVLKGEFERLKEILSQPLL